MSYPSRSLSSLLGIAVAGTAYVYAYSKPVTRPDITATGVPLVKDLMVAGPDKSVAPPRVGAYFASSRVENARTATPALAAAPAQRQVLDQYCVTCHNERLKTGGLVLEQIDLDQVSANAETLERVVRKLRTGQMPPAGAPRPDRPAIDAFASSLETALDHAAAAAPNPGRIIIHRLNRTEYANAIRDLLALDIDTRAWLPADDTDPNGFDNNADVLSISPLLLDRYLSASHKVARLALGRPLSGPTIETYAIPKLLTQDDRLSEELPFGSRGGVPVRHNFPVDGEYSVKIHLQTNLYNYVRGLAEPHQLEVRLDRARIKTFTVGGKKVPGEAPASWAGTVYGSPEWEHYALDADAGLEVRFPAKAGMHVVGVSFVKTSWEADEVLQPRETGWPLSTDEIFDGNPAVESVTIEGPYESAGPGETPSRRRIFACRPKGGADEEACARTILSAVGRRAYRRSLTNDDVQTLLASFRRGRRAASFEAGVQAALELILVSPDFLFRVETDPEAVATGTAYRLSDAELASRLSFFLWSSIPDDELLDLASRGRLKDAAVLEKQVRRMLADGRSKALVDNFAGQWLQLRDLRGFVPDADLFPEFDENLREAFQQETELFIDSQIRENRSVVDLVSADYTFLNERLAKHYEIPNVYGNHFRKVMLTDGRRGGLLGQASLLTVTSYPNRTSPVLRGKWLLDKMLGTPPPPPPPNVPALKDKGENGRPQSVRDRLQEHRKNPACASCHSKMDPLGFALDHFDAVGAWRTTDEGTPVDASGALPDGARFQGLSGLRQLLLDRREQFVETVIEKLLGYSLGRGVEFYDQPAVRSIAREAAANDNRWSAIILGIVKSMPFQMRRSES
jgi:mono/diheme cytochrome c family protein